MEFTLVELVLMICSISKSSSVFLQKRFKPETEETFLDKLLSIILLYATGCVCIW